MAPGEAPVPDAQAQVRSGGTFVVGEKQPAFKPHLVVLPLHRLLLVNPHTVLVEEAAPRRAPRRVPAHRAPVRSGRPSRESTGRVGSGVVIRDMGHLLLQSEGGSATAAEAWHKGDQLATHRGPEWA